MALDLNTILDLLTDSERTSLLSQLSVKDKRGNEGTPCYVNKSMMIKTPAGLVTAGKIIKAALTQPEQPSQIDVTPTKKFKVKHKQLKPSVIDPEQE